MNTLVSENRNVSQQRSEQFVAPAASVIEDNDAYLLNVEMPGVNKEGLEVSVENNELRIIGRRSLPEINGTLVHRESRTENLRDLLLFLRERRLLAYSIRPLCRMQFCGKF